MLRKLGLCVLIATSILVACGRQVTPDRTTPGGNSGVLPGHMLIKYRTAAPMDFTSVVYTIVFNTSGNGQPPYANGLNIGYKNYSFILAVGGSSGATSAVLYQIIQAPSGTTGQPQQVKLFYAPNQIVYTPNSDGQFMEFTLNIDRTLLYGLPHASPTPTGVTPGPTSSPQSTWLFNFITTDLTAHPLDALGAFGVNDTTFNLPLPVNLPFDYMQQLTVPTGATQASNQAAQLAGGEIINNP